MRVGCSFLRSVGSEVRSAEGLFARPDLGARLTEEGRHEDERRRDGRFREAEEEPNDHHVRKVLSGGLAGDDDGPDDDRDGDKHADRELVQQPDARVLGGELSEIWRRMFAVSMSGSAEMRESRSALIGGRYARLERVEGFAHRRRTRTTSNLGL